MKKPLFIILLLIAVKAVFSQAITAPASSYTRTTVYTNGVANDIVFGFCTPNSTGVAVTGTLVATAGVANCTFVWTVFNSTTNSYTPYVTQTGLTTSTITGLPSGGYHVTIKNSAGTVIACDLAWVWVNQTTATVGALAPGCSPFSLNGTASAVSNYTYYNPPPEPFLISATTTITACFKATHTYVSDLGFYLVGPAACGSPIVTLSPNPGSNGQGAICNSGDNVNNLCFTTNASPNFNPCSAATPYTGTYDSYGPNPGTNINWSSLYGCDAAVGGWKVQIYDCIGGDVGTLTNASVTFSGNSGCGASTVTYNSGNINSAILDNSCTPATASIYMVPTTPATSPIVINNTITYQWTSVPASSIPNSTSSLTPSISIVPTTDTWYYLTVTDNVGCAKKDSAFFDYSPPGTPTITPAGPFCVNASTVNLSATPVGGAWSGPGITNTTTGTFNPATAGAGTFTITYATPGACGGSTITTIAVNATPTVTAPASSTVCNGATAPAGTFTLTAGGTASWTNNNPAIGMPASGTGNPGSFTAVNNGSTVLAAVVSVTPSFSGCTGTPVNYTITVSPTPSLNAVSGQTVCNGAAVAAINFTSVPAGASIAWTNSNTGIGVGASGSGNILSFTGTNSTGAPVSGNFSAVPTLAGCAGVPLTFTVSVSPTPVLSAVSSQTVCEGNPITAIVFTTVPSSGSIINWSNSSPSIGLASNGSGNIATYNASNGTGAIVNAAFTATPAVGTCTGTPVNFTITVNPAINANAVSGFSICNAGTVPASAFASTPAGAIFSWTNSNSTIGLASSGTGNYTSFTATNTTAGPVNAVISVTPSLNGCAGPVMNYTITVNPAPAAPAVANITYCLNQPATALTATATAGGTLNWWGTSASGGTSSASGPVPSTSTMATYTYYVSQTVFGCESPRAQIVVAVGTLSSITDPPDLTVCPGDVVPLQAFPSTPSGASISWTNSNATTGLAASGSGNVPSFTAINTGQSPVTSQIVVTPNIGSCIGASVTYSITVKPLPIVTVTDITACDNAPVAAVNWISIPAGASFVWSNSNTTIGAAAGGINNIPSFTAVNAGSGPVNAIITVTPSLNGCSGLSSSFNITVNPTPSAPVAGISMYCQNDVSNPLTATGSNLLWYNASTGGTGFVSAPNPSTVNTGTVTAFVSQTLFGCESPRTPVITIINNLPTATLVPVISKCPPLCTDLSVTSPNTLTSYNWNLGDGTIATGSATVTNHCYPIPGKYTVTVTITDNNNCSASLTYPNAVTVYDLPDAQFDFGPQPVTFLDATVTFTSTSLGASPLKNDWLFGDNSEPVINKNMPVHTYLNPGSYIVQLTTTSAFGCVDIIESTVIVENDFTLYIPNSFTPNGDGLNDTFSAQGLGIDTKDFKMSIFDRWGVMIYSTDDITKPWTGTVGGGKTGAQDDVYVWKLQCKTLTGVRVERAGHVTIIR